MPTQFIDPKPTDQTTDTMLLGLHKSFSPQKVYVLGLQQIVSGASPGDDLFNGWRYLKGIGPDMAVAALAYQQTGGDASFTGITGGPQIAKAVLAAEGLANLPNLPDGTYETRLLSIPGLLTDCFWLRSQAGGSDWVIPFDTVATGIEEKRIYLMDAFLALARPLAAARLAADQSRVYHALPNDPDPAVR
jgi:hypothetical protein